MVELYIWYSCPFCQKVMRAARDMGLEENQDYTLMEAGPGTPGRAFVEKTGGKSMVPFLVDGEVSMYESDDIIAYLKKVVSAKGK